LAAISSLGDFAGPNFCTQTNFGQCAWAPITSRRRDAVFPLPVRAVRNRGGQRRSPPGGPANALASPLVNVLMKAADIQTVYPSA
jgi:hypothetical protein